MEVINPTNKLPGGVAVPVPPPVTVRPICDKGGDFRRQVLFRTGPGSTPLPRFREQNPEGVPSKAEI